MTYAEFLRMRQNIRYMLYRFRYDELIKQPGMGIREAEITAEPTASILEEHVANVLAAGCDPKDIEFMASEMRKDHAKQEPVA